MQDEHGRIEPMGGNPRENTEGKGFWDGGTAGQAENGQSAGRPSGLPGRRSPSRVGYRTDLEFSPPESGEEESNSKPVI